MEIVAAILGGTAVGILTLTIRNRALVDPTVVIHGNRAANFTRFLRHLRHGG